MSSSPFLSLIIPAYNEERLILTSLDELIRFLPSCFPTFEVLVVDDGSLDQTAARVEAYAHDHPQVRLLRCEKNTGKGGAIRLGVLNSLGEQVVFMDADLPYELNAIGRMTSMLESYPVVIGSRVLPGSEIQAHVPWVRRLAGQIFRSMIQTLIFPGIPDTQCGIKGFRAEAAREIFGRLSILDFGFDVEMLYIARKLGYAVVPVPVRLVNFRADSKVRLISDSLQMTWDLLLIRWNDWRGKYDRPSREGQP